MKKIERTICTTVVLGLLAIHAGASASLPDCPLRAPATGPRVLARVEPQRPGWVQDTVGQAISIVRVQLLADGSVAEILCVESLGTGVDLNDWNLKVADAVRLWRFEPGQPTKTTVSVRLGPKTL